MLAEQPSARAGSAGSANLESPIAVVFFIVLRRARDAEFLVVAEDLRTHQQIVFVFPEIGLPHQPHLHTRGQCGMVLHFLCRFTVHNDFGSRGCTVVLLILIVS